MTETEKPLQMYGAADFAKSPAEGTPWLWEPYLARGMITLLTSRWKTGKTTLLSVLLQRLSTGETLAGAPVARGSAIVLSEEPFALWRSRHETLGFGRNIHFCSRPFHRRPTPREWHLLVNALAESKPDLVVIDPLAMLLPGALENHASGLLDALEPLHRITRTGAALLLIHHPKKGPDSQALSPRGTGALTGFADILVDLDRPTLPGLSDRVRRLTVASRLSPSSRRLIEWTPDGRDYVALPDPPSPDGFDAGWPVLRMVLEDVPSPPTRLEMLGNWPQDYDAPSKATLARWLTQATEQSLVTRLDTGRQRHPYRYWLPGKPIPEGLPPLELIEP